MSFVNTAGSKGLSPETEAIRARSKERERSLEDKHREDLTTLRSTHKSEIDRLQTIHEERELKQEERHRNAMNEKDLQHQREIQSVRNLYEKRLRSDDKSKA